MPSVRRRLLPMRTPISELGLRPEDAKRLTPAARRLTKGDLIAMMEGEVPPAAQALTVRDLNSISQVYAARARAGFVGRPTPGCCCSCGRSCCCCCCDSVLGESANA